MRRLLVTGGAGFVGSNFVHHWLGAHPGDRVVVLDALTYAGNRATLLPFEGNPAFRFVHGDICSAPLVDDLLRQERIDTVVHFAAETHVDRSIAGPSLFVQTNVVGTHVLLECTRRFWLDAPGVPEHRFHHVSTDEVYGSLGPEDPPFTEQSHYAPSSPYSASKAASDHLVRAYHRTYGLRVTLSNCSNNYGRFHFPEKLIPLCMINLLNGRPVPIYGDGRNIRDWLDVGDHCSAIELILERGAAGEAYNIGGRAEVQNLQLVRSLCEIAEQTFAARPELRERYPLFPGKPEEGRRAEDLIRFVQDRPGHDRRYAVDCSKIEKLGWDRRVSLMQGLRTTFNWFVDNPDWWQRSRAADASAARKRDPGEVLDPV